MLVRDTRYVGLKTIKAEFDNSVKSLILLIHGEVLDDDMIILSILGFWEWYFFLNILGKRRYYIQPSQSWRVLCLGHWVELKGQLGLDF